MNGRRRFTRSLVLSTFLFSILLFGDKKSPSNLTLRDFVAAIAGRFLRRLCDPSLFILYKSILREITIQSYERLQFNLTRDYTSVLRDITLHHYEISRFIIARDYASVLREITFRCCERLHFDVARDYNSISIIQSAVTFYRRYEWTADGLFSRPFFFQLFFLAIKNPRPSLLSASRASRASRASPVYSYGAYARAYCSGLLLGLRSANE